MKDDNLECPLVFFLSLLSRYFRLEPWGKLRILSALLLLLLTNSDVDEDEHASHVISIGERFSRR